MLKSTLLLLTLLSSAFPSTLTLSKDTLKVYNNLSSSIKDEIIITNNSADTISLDSAYMLFDVFDTSGMSKFLANDRKLEAYWIESNNGDFQWYLNEIGPDKYKLVKKFFGPNNIPIPGQIPPHDSCFFKGLQIGVSLVSSEIPRFPKYIRGSLQLFYSNNEEIKIKIYSDDLRTSIIPKIGNKREIKADHPQGYFTLNGKRIKNSGKKYYRINPVKIIR